MKKLDLNLELDKKIVKDMKIDDVPRASGNLIKTAVQNACSMPRIDPRSGQQIPVNPSMDDQEKYVDLSQQIRDMEKGIVLLEDDLFRWVKEKFNLAKLPMQPGLSEILVGIRHKLIEAELKKKDDENKKVKKNV